MIENTRMKSAERSSAVATAIGLPIIVIACLACIQWVDLPVATWIHASRLDTHAWMLVLLSVPVVVGPVAGLFLLVYAIRRYWGTPGQWERITFILSASLLASVAIKDMLKRMFGRTWPRDVSDPGPAVMANCPPPSLGYINDGFHSFHFFGGNSKPFLAFPSGSTIMLLALVIPLCVVLPRARVPLFAFTAFSLICFVLTNTHFVSDVIAGVYVGAVVGLIASQKLPLLGRSG